MFSPITVPYGAKMLFNTLQLKPGVNFDDVETAVGEVCNFVTAAYGGVGGFLGGQIFRFSGAMDAERFVGSSATPSDQIAIITYWRAFEDHERSHRDGVFQSKFGALLALCSEQQEAAYEMMWQGMPGGGSNGPG